MTYRLLNDFKSFTATVEMLGSEDGTDPTNAPPWGGWKFAFRDGKTRTEMGTTNFLNSDGSEAGAETKRMGMDRLVTIDDGTNAVAQLFPGRKVWVEEPYEAGTVPWRTLKVQTEKLGAEAVDGLACIKSKVTFTDEKGGTMSLFVWNATSLSNFPVRMLIREGRCSVVTTFKDVQFREVPADQFAPPPSYRKLTMRELEKEIETASQNEDEEKDPSLPPTPGPGMSDADFLNAKNAPPGHSDKDAPVLSAMVLSSKGPARCSKTNGWEAVRIGFVPQQGCVVQTGKDEMTRLDLGFASWDARGQPGTLLGRVRLFENTAMRVSNLSAAASGTNVTNHIDLDFLAGEPMLVTIPKAWVCGAGITENDMLRLTMTAGTPAGTEDTVFVFAPKKGLSVLSGSLLAGKGTAKARLVTAGKWLSSSDGDVKDLPASAPERELWQPSSGHPNK